MQYTYFKYFFIIFNPTKVTRSIGNTNLRITSITNFTTPLVNTKISPQVYNSIIFNSIILQNVRSLYI